MPIHTRRARLSPALAALVCAAMLMPAAAPAQGLAGPYLAAEQASRRGDVEEAARYYTRALARDSQNRQLLERGLVNHLAAGHMAEAIALARRLETIDKGHHIAVLLLSSEALRGGRAKQAAELLETSGGDAAPFVAGIMQAWAIHGTGDSVAARAQLAQMEQDGIGGPLGTRVAAYHLGLIAAASGNDDVALAAFDRAAEGGGLSSSRLTAVRAGTLARLGRGAEAREAVDARLAETLGDGQLEGLSRSLAAGETPAPMISAASDGAAEALFQLSQLFARGPNIGIGLAYARMATYLRPDLAPAHLLSAEMLEQNRQYRLAIAAFDRVADDAPEGLDAAIGKARAQREVGEVDTAIAVLRDLVARFPEQLEAHMALGDMLRVESRFAEAAEAYDGAVALIGASERRHWPLYYQRGIAYERSKQWPKAEADFRRALELQPDQPLVLNYLGYTWVEMGVNLDEAQAMIEKAVEQRPEDGFIIDSLGWVLYRRGDFEGALKHLERAAELQPVDPVINDHLGDALWMVGREIEARFQWKRSLSFEPEEENAVRIRRKLDLGLDVVQREETAAGNPPIIGQTVSPAPAPATGAKDGG